VTSAISNRNIDLIINIPRGNGSNALTDGYVIRRLSIDHHIPLITNLQIAQMFLECLSELEADKISIKSWREFIETKCRR